MALLEIDDLRVSYDNIEALKGVSLKVKAKEIVLLIGANGAGKTTTLRAVNGLIRPRSGDIRFDGESLVPSPRTRSPRAAIGLVVLATDQTMEHEFHSLLRLPGVAVFESRLYNDNDIRPETLRAIGPRIAPGVALLLPGVGLDVVAFACTSATMTLGEARCSWKFARRGRMSRARRRSPPRLPRSARSARSRSGS